MARALGCVAYVALFLLTTGTGVAQWAQTNGPFGGVPVYSVASADSNLFASTFSSAYRSSDYGVSWVHGNLPQGDSIGTASLVAMGGLLFAASKGIFRSTDFGLSWSETNDTLMGGQVGPLAVFDTILFDAPGTSLFRSTDEGGHWMLLESGSVPWPIECVVPVDSVLFIGTYDGWAGGSLLRSTDEGKSWFDMGIGDLPVWCLAKSGRTVFAGTDDGVFRSTDLGATWTAQNSGLQDSLFGDRLEIRRIVTKSAKGGSQLWIFAGTALSGVFRSTDDGESWQAINAGLMDKRILDLTRNAGTDSLAGMLYAATEFGVFRSTDNGDHWTSANHGLGYSSVESLAGYSVKGNDGECIIAGTYGGGVFRTTNSGGDWITVNSGLRTWDVESVAALSLGEDSATIWFAVAPPFVFRKSNCDTAWSPVAGGLTSSQAGSFAVFPPNPGPSRYIFAWGSHGVFRSQDTGKTWNSSNAELTDATVWGLVMKDSALYAGTSNGFYRSTDWGGSWSLVSMSIGGQFLVVSGPRLVTFSGINCWVSTDNGSTWPAVDFPYGAWVRSVVAVGRFLIAACDGSGVICSVNGGDSWSSLNDGFPDSINVSAMFGSLDEGKEGGSLFVSTGRGVWRRPLPQVVSVRGAVSDLPVAFSLRQNYPNPFNPSTKIQFTIANRRLTTVKVYDVLGRDVATLVDGVKEPGMYTVQFDARDLASGVYFYRLQAGSFAETKRLLLVR